MGKDTCDETTNCQSCEKADPCSQEEKGAHDQKMLDRRMSSIKYKFMVMSGKGGVGKSSVATNRVPLVTLQGHDEVVQAFNRISERWRQLLEGGAEKHTVIA